MGSPLTQGWAIAAASLPVKKTFSPKKKESLSLVISGDIPTGSSSRIKEVLINRFNSQICPAVCGFERDLRIDDLTHVLLEKNSIIARFSSTEAKNVVLDNRKLLSVVCSESDPSTSENPKTQWKMFVSPFLDNQDLKNQNIVLRAFKSLQIKNNPSLSFKVYPQGYSIKIVSVDGSKYFFPFDSNQSPKQFLKSKGIACKESPINSM